MSIFKVGDTVRRVKGFEGDTLVIGNVYVVSYFDPNKVQVEGDSGRYAPEFFELVQPEVIQVGDTVRRTESVPVSLQIDYPVMQVGAEFVVRDTGESLGVLYFHETAYIGWSGKSFQKVEKPVPERLAANVAAELLIEGTTPMQYYMSGAWNDVHVPHVWTIENLREVPLRIKPKTIEINGVTVLAPLKPCTSRTYVWYIDMYSGVVRDIYIHKGHKLKYFWATEEDAQAVLDAMLLPIKDL